MPHIRDVGQSANHGLELDQPNWSRVRQDGPEREADSHRTEEPRIRAALPLASSGPPLLSETIDELEDWTLNAELERIRRRFDAPPAGQQSAATVGPPHLESFTLHGNPSIPNLRPGRRHPTKSAAAEVAPAGSRRKRGRSSPVVWGALSVGLMAFVCGAVLLGWSLAVGRSDLWSLGMPIMLGGQFGLLLGLLLQLNSLWEGSRHTVDKLEEVDERLDDLDQTAALLSSSHSSPAQAFYIHMAGGASPHLLLADLKGQLDLLAVQMARQ